MKVHFRFDGIGTREFRFPESSTDLPPVYFFGVKKGGSTLLARVVRDLVPASPYTLIEFPKKCFSRGLPFYKCVEDIDGTLMRKGYAFGTFRWFPENWIIDLHHPDPPRCMLLVRDPRDMLVSLYFSDAKSHAIPDSGPLRESMLRQRAELKDGTLSIDEYVSRQAPQMLRNYYRTLQLTTLPNCRVVRYEDIIYDKHHLVTAVAEMLRLGEANGPLIDEVARRHDVVPAESRPDDHIRQVHPGNHRNVLHQTTVDQLTAAFQVVLERFGYAGA